MAKEEVKGKAWIKTIVKTRKRARETSPGVIVDEKVVEEKAIFETKMSKKIKTLSNRLSGKYWSDLANLRSRRRCTINYTPTPINKRLFMKNETSSIFCQMHVRILN